MIKRTKPLYPWVLIAKKLSYCSFRQNFEKQIKRVSASDFFAQRQQISQLLSWGVTVIWVPPSFVYPHTHITKYHQGYEYPPWGYEQRGSKNNKIRKKILKIFSIYIFDTKANLYNVTSNKLTVYN